MTSWIQPVKIEDLKDDQRYFFGRQNRVPGFDHCWHFSATNIKGKAVMSIKPGIADWFTAAQMRILLQRHPDMQAVLVPSDAHKRWKRRQKVWK
jgi:hypothetical protein